MPQFQPLYWITMILWTYQILIIVVSYAHTVLLPNILKLKNVRNYILFK